MSDESGVVPVDERVIPPVPPGPGEQLRAARLQQGLEIADVARQLKLFPRQVDAMERDDYAALPSLVFARGFIRNYARLLGLDAKALPKITGAVPDATTDELPAVIAAPKTEAVAASVSLPGGDLVMPVSLSPAGHSGRSRGWAIGGVVICVAVVVGYLILHQSASSSNESVVAVTLPQTSVATTEPAPVPPSPAVPDPTVAAAAAGGPAMERPAGIPIPEVTTVPPYGTAVAAANPADTGTGPAIRLSFTRDAWVEIRDRSGAVVFSELNRAGAQRVVRGKPPFSLVVGNASGVTVAFDGRDIDLAPYTRTDVAHLTLE